VARARREAAARKEAEAKVERKAKPACNLPSHFHALGKFKFLFVFDYVLFAKLFVTFHSAFLSI
jgi:hypothetical protein